MLHEAMALITDCSLSIPELCGHVSPVVAFSAAGEGRLYQYFPSIKLQQVDGDKLYPLPKVRTRSPVHVHSMHVVGAGA